MSQHEKPIYAPGSIKLNDKLNWFCLRYSFNAEKMIEFIKANTNEKGYVNLQIKEKREPDQWGNTHTAVLDTWSPKEGGQQQRQAPPRKKDPVDDWPGSSRKPAQAAPAQDDDDSGVPF